MGSRSIIRRSATTKCPLQLGLVMTPSGPPDLCRPPLVPLDTDKVVDHVSRSHVAWYGPNVRWVVDEPESRGDGVDAGVS